MKFYNKKITGLFALIIVFGMACGCGSGSGGDTDNTSTAMGRYEETELSLPDTIIEPDKIYLNQDGSVSIFDRVMRQMFTENTDASFQAKTVLKKVPADGYLSATAFSESGDAFIAYVPYEEPASEDDTEESSEADSYSPEYFYIPADGEPIPVSLALNDSWLYDFAFTQDGTLIAYDLTGSIYQVDPVSGSLKKLFTTGSISGFAVTTNYIIVLDSDNIYFYNLSTGETLQNPDPVMEFLQNQNVDHMAAMSNNQPYHFYEDEDNTIYILNENGLYRYIINGSSVEQLINGKINNLGNTSYTVNSFLQDANGDFYVLFNENRLMKYSYNSKLSSMPEKTLKVYSVYDNDGVNQMIGLYRAAHPDTYVEYDVGIGKNDSVTYEDALKLLNTEILSGNGPDILILDDLNIANYQSKDMLLNLNDYMDTIDPGQKLLANITQCYTENSGLYAIPTRFKLPVIAAAPDILNQITDLSSLADAVEKQRTLKPDGQILELYTEEDILKLAMTAYGKELAKEELISKEELTSLLTQADRIAAVETAHLSSEEKESAEKRKELYKQLGSEWNNLASGRLIRIMTGDCVIAAGESCGFYCDFNSFSSLNRSTWNIDYRFGITKDSREFLPTCIMSVSSSSKQTDAAIDFIKTALAEESQDMDGTMGFPVNTLSLQNIYERGVSDEAEASSISCDSSLGGIISYNTYWPDEQTAKDFDAYIRSLTTPCKPDPMTYNTILEKGAECLSGNIDVETAVSDIMDKLTLRKAE